MGPPGRQTHAPRARDFGWDHRYIAGLLLFRARECVCGVVEQLGNVSKFGALQRFLVDGAFFLGIGSTDKYGDAALICVSIANLCAWHVTRLIF